MKTTIVMSLLACISGALGCFVERTSSREQSLCTIGDQEAGYCTLRVLTRDVARSQVPVGETIVSETYGVCDSSACLVRIELPNLVVTSVCLKDEYGYVTCSSASCVPSQTCPPPPPR